MYSKTCVKWPLSKRPIIEFQDRLLLNEGQKYCRILQVEHSAILLTFIKLPTIFKIMVLSIFCGHFIQVLLNGRLSLHFHIYKAKKKEDLYPKINSKKYLKSYGGLGREKYNRITQLNYATLVNPFPAIQDNCCLPSHLLMFFESL